MRPLLRGLLTHLPPVIIALGTDNPYMRAVASLRAGRPSVPVPKERSFQQWLTAAVVAVYDPRPDPWDQVRDEFPFLDPPNPAYALEMGRAGGYYGVLRILGAGGMGVVFDAYLGDECRAHNRVALKTMSAKILSPELVARFAQETEILAQLNSYPNVVQFRHSHVNARDGRLYVAMEHVFGPTLHDFLDLHAGRPVPAGLAVDLLRQIAIGLAAAHGFKPQIVHRDLKPANVFLQRESGRTDLANGWRVRVADFGQATLVEGTHAFASGIMLGTDGYRAPEQLNGSKIGGRTDVFALGTIAFQMLTGNHPRRYEGSLWPERRARLTDACGSGPLAALVLEMLDGERTLRPHSHDVVRRLAEIESTLMAQEAGTRPPAPAEINSVPSPHTAPNTREVFGRAGWPFLTAADFQSLAGDTLPKLVVGKQPTLEWYRKRMYMARPRHVEQAYVALQSLRDERTEEDSHQLHIFWIGGQSGSGKSVLLLQMMEAAVSQGLKVVWEEGNARKLTADLTEFKRQWDASQDPAALPDLLFVDDLYRPGGWNEDEVEAVSKLVGGNPACPWPVVVTCGPQDFEDRLWQDADQQVIAVRPWRLEPVKAAEAGDLRKWFARRGGKPYTPGAAFRQDEGLLISMVFEFEPDGVDGFALRFAKRLKHYELAEPLLLLLALNRLYIPAPRRWLTDDEWVKLFALNQSGDFSLDTANGAEYLRLTHPHLSDAIYKKLHSKSNAMAYANDLAKAIQRAWETDHATLRLVARALAAGNERLAAEGMPFLAEKVGRAWREDTVEDLLGPSSLGRDVAVSLACWRARQPELNLDAKFGVPLLDRARTAVAGAGPAWPALWQRLFDAYPTDTAVTADALAWLNVRENAGTQAWSFLWRRLMQSPAVTDAAKDTLGKLALTWLRADPDRYGSGVVLEALWDALESERKPRAVGHKEFYRVVLHWLRTPGRRTKWPTVWKRLTAVPDLMAAMKGDLLLVAGEWLQKYYTFWQTQVEIAAAVAGEVLARPPQEYDLFKKLNRSIGQLAKWVLANPWHDLTKSITETLCTAPALAEVAAREQGAWETLHDLPVRLKAAQQKRWNALELARREKRVLRGKVMRYDDAKELFLVQLHDFGRQVVLPLRCARLPPAGQPAELPGQELADLQVSDKCDSSFVVVYRCNPEYADIQTRLSLTRPRLKEIQIGDPVVGVVKKAWRKFFLVDWNGTEVHLPFTECFWAGASGPAAIKAGDPFRGRVTVIDPRGWVMVSPRPTEIDWAVLATPLAVGTATAGTVLHLSVDHGAFVRLPSGLVGVVLPAQFAGQDSETGSIDWRTGTDVNVFVCELVIAKEKLRLSLRPPAPTPPAPTASGKPAKPRPVRAKHEMPLDVIGRYPTGTVISGTVSNLMNYGAFIEIEEGFEGLLHVSEMSWVRKVSNPSEVVQKGQKVTCVVLNVDKEKRRLALGLKQMAPDPWKHDIPARYRLNDRVRGRIANLTKFGVFVELELGVQSLLHISQLADRPAGAPEFQVGDVIDAHVIHVDAVKRQIRLSQKSDSGPDGGSILHKAEGSSSRTEKEWH